MSQPFFQLSASQPPSSRIALEPVYNVLNSMALLSLAEAQPALDSWVRSAAAAMAPAERAANRLIFEQLGCVLVAHAGAADFESYLDALTQQHPQALRDQALAELADGVVAAPSSAEAQDLLDDPFRLHDMVVSHLRGVWDRSMREEWARTVRGLENQVRLLQNSIPNSGMSPSQIAHNLHSLVGHPAGADSAEELVFVPSAHTGRHTSELNFGGTRWLFFDSQLSRAALLRDSPVREQELIGRINALSEPMRLRVLELLAQHDELSLQEIMEQLGASQPNTSRYLKSLSVYTSERRGRDGKKYYRLVPTQLELTFQALRQSLLSAQPNPAPDGSPTAELPAAVARWLNPQGIVSAWPGREGDRLAVLEYLAGFFEDGMQYTEREVNAIIVEHVFSYARDHVTIRRDLVDFQLLSRAANGSRYWRNAEYQAAGAASS